MTAPNTLYTKMCLPVWFPRWRAHGREPTQDVPAVHLSPVPAYVWSMTGLDADLLNMCYI